MADSKLSNLPAASALAVGDLTYVDQSAASVKATVQQVAAGVSGPALAAFTGKTTPVDADVIALSDSAASSAAKKVTWANIKATLKAYFDTLYSSRTVLTGDRTYYVRTDGNNANTGLVNNAGGAFATIQHAMDVISNTLDLAGYNVTVQLGAAGTWSGDLKLGSLVGTSIQTANTPGNYAVTLVGDVAAPENYILESDAYASITAYNTGYNSTYQVKGVTFDSTVGDTYGLLFVGAVTVDIDTCNFTLGADLAAVISCSQGARTQIYNDVVVDNGGAQEIILESNNQSMVRNYADWVFNDAITLNNATCACTDQGYIQWTNAATGTLIGVKYALEGLSLLNGAANVPGTLAGTAAHGSQAY